MIPITRYIQEVSETILTSTSTVSNDEVSLSEALSACFDSLKRIKEKRNIIFIIGNGGSAAIASHVQNDLCKGSGIRAMVFNETPLLTAYANDMSYQEAFNQMLYLWASSGDLLIAISSSGQSENILNAVKTARDRGCLVITFSGFRSENPLRLLGDINFYVPSCEYGIVETAHATILHYITDMVKNES